MSISSKSILAGTITRTSSVRTVGIHVTFVIAVVAVVDINCKKKEHSRTHPFAVLATKNSNKWPFNFVNSLYLDVDTSKTFNF